MRANFNAVHGVAFSPDGQRLLSGGEDPKDVVRLLDLGSQRHVATLAPAGRRSILVSGNVNRRQHVW